MAIKLKGFLKDDNVWTILRVNSGNEFFITREGPRNQNDYDLYDEFYNPRECMRFINKWKKEKLTLGDIIDKLSNCDKDKKVYTVFVRGGLYGITDDTMSHRGNYYDLAINFTSPENAKTAGEIIEKLKNDIESGWMTGYKGGDFKIEREIDVAIACYGDCGPYITDVVEEEDRILLIQLNRE